MIHPTDELELLTTIDHALAALGHPDTETSADQVNKATAIGRLIAIRDHLVPRTPNGIKAHILRQIEYDVRWSDMISDELWGREEPINQIYDWCAKHIGRTPTQHADIENFLSDAIEILNLG